VSALLFLFCGCPSCLKWTYFLPCGCNILWSGDLAAQTEDFFVQESGSLNLNFSPEGLSGGPLLAVRGSEFVSFFDWETCKCVRQIDVAAESIVWNPAGDMLAIICQACVYLLKYHREIVAQVYGAGLSAGEDGIEEAFEVVTEVIQLKTSDSE
jgi:hypothetical protein